MNILAVVLVVMGISGILAGTLGNKFKARVRVKDHPSKKGGEVGQTARANKRGGLWATIITPLAVIGGFTLACLTWNKFARPNTPGSGLPLLHGTKIAIEKYEGDEYSELPKYEPVSGDYPTYLKTNGKEEVYVVVWKRNGNDQWVASTQGPELYTEQPLSRSTVESFSIFLGPKSKIDELKDITAIVDMSKRQTSTGRTVPANN